MLVYALNFLLGSAQGIVAFVLLMAGGETARSYLSSPLLSIAFWIIGMIPMAVGTASLVKSISSNYFTNCLILVGLNVVLNVVLMIAVLPFIGDDIKVTEVVLSSLFMLAASLVTCFLVLGRR